MPHLLRLFAALALISFAASAYAQEDAAERPPTIAVPDDFAIGLIDINRIFRLSTALGGVRDEVAAREQRYREEITAEEERLRKQQEELSQKRSVLSPQEFAIEEASFRSDVEGLQKRVNERNQELQELMAQSQQQVQEEAVRIIAEIALERNFALVFDASQLVIAAEQINISDEVVERLNQRFPSLEIPEAGSAQEAEGQGN